MEGSSGAAVGIVVLFCFRPVSIVKLELAIDANQRLCPFLAWCIGSTKPSFFTPYVFSSSAA